MKMKRTAIPLLLFFSAILTIVVSTAFADSKHITFSEPVMVGSIVLPADTYRVVWSGSGPEVLVSFMKGNKTLATAPATLVFEKSAYEHRAFETKVMPDNTRVLTRISFSDKSLIFEQLE